MHWIPLIWWNDRWLWLPHHDHGHDPEQSSNRVLPNTSKRKKKTAKPKGATLQQSIRGMCVWHIKQWTPTDTHLTLKTLQQTIHRTSTSTNAPREKTIQTFPPDAIALQKHANIIGTKPIHNATMTKRNLTHASQMDEPPYVTTQKAMTRGNTWIDWANNVYLK